jgi:hypothetical protein
MIRRINRDTLNPRAMPALPGAQYKRSTSGLAAIFQASALLASARTQK